MIKKILLQTLFLVAVLGFHPFPVRHDITVKLKVHGTDEQLSNKILADLRTGLGNKSGIVIAADTTDSTTFTITVQYATLRSAEKIDGIFMNFLLTRRIRTAKNESADMLVKSAVYSSSKTADIDRTCSSMIDQFDAQYFDKERHASTVIQ